MKTLNNFSMTKKNQNSRISRDSQDIAMTAPTTSPTATQLLYLEDETTTSTISTVKDDTELGFLFVYQMFIIIQKIVVYLNYYYFFFFFR